MAAPVFVGAGTGVVVTTGSAAVTKTGCIAGNFIVIQIMFDGLGDTAGSAAVNLENLAGVDAFTTTLVFASSGGEVGSPTAARHGVFLARVIADGTVSRTFASPGTGEDFYCRVYEFSGVNTGTTLNDVVENGSAGAFVNGVGTSASIADTGVTTLGADRLAVQFVAANDDIAVGPFTGMTGGTWAEPVAEFASATGTDGCIQLQTATIASAGTINGGSVAVASASWGVVGFALIPPAGAGGSTYTKAGYGRESL